MKNARNKEVKHSELFLACDQLVTDRGMVIYWKKVKGHSQTSGPNKDGNDEADRLAKLGEEQGTPWEFQNEWLPKSPTARGLTNESAELQTLHRVQPHLRLEKDLLVYSCNNQGLARWVVPT